MQITLQLDDRARRPIANLNWFNGCRALIDTGALFPIWNRNENMLVEKPGGSACKKEYNIWRLWRRNARKYIQDSF